MARKFRDSAATLRDAPRQKQPTAGRTSRLNRESRRDLGSRDFSGAVPGNRASAQARSSLDCGGAGDAVSGSA